MPCCAAFNDKAGEWYFPDETPVPGPLQGLAITFYRNRGDDGTVNLNRLSGIMMPTGKFCCEIPDSIGVTDRVCANIGKLHMHGYKALCESLRQGLIIIIAFVVYTIITISLLL